MYKYLSTIQFIEIIHCGSVRLAIVAGDAFFIYQNTAIAVPITRSVTTTANTMITFPCEGKDELGDLPDVEEREVVKLDGKLVPKFVIVRA